jgi:hypothetical protein
VCDVCLEAGRDAGPDVTPFLACSLACLTAHLAEAHAGEGRDAPARAAAYQARVNRNVAHNREWYAGHRARVTELLVGDGAAGSALGVLGAGNGSDLDLPALGERFDELHLVDLDGEALERCRAGAPASLEGRLVLHAGVDLSGFTDRLDAWGDDFPTEADLGRAAQPAIHAVLRRLGRTFDVVASTCALSQLAVPYHRAWILPAPAWASLHAAITAVHLATIAGATSPGGTGILIFDVLSSKAAPELRTLPDGEVAAFVQRHVASGARLEPDPAGLLARLGTLGRLVASPRLAGPWLWNIGAETQLVYGLTFTRA